MQGFTGPRYHATNRRGNAFTLLEMLVSLAIFTVMLVLLMSMVSQTGRVWQITNGQKTNRETARVLLGMISRDLASSVFPLNPANTNSLQFLCESRFNPKSIDSTNLNPGAAFWQAATPGAGGTNGDVSDVGYFVTWVACAGVPYGTLCRLQIPSGDGNSIFQNPKSRSLTTAIQTYAVGLANTNLSDPNAYKGLLATNVLGLWIVLYDHSGNIMPSPYDSRLTTTRPAAADIAITMLDTALVQRMTPAIASSITSSYPTNISGINAFLTSLPASIRGGVQLYKTRVQFPQAQ